MKKTNKKGFTLVELLVVIVIVGVLATVIVPNVTSSIEKAEKSAAEQDAMSAYKSLITTMDLTTEILPTNMFYYTEEYVVLVKNGSLDTSFTKEIDDTFTVPKLYGSANDTYTINGKSVAANDIVVLQDGTIVRKQNGQWVDYPLMISDGKTVDASLHNAIALAKRFYNNVDETKRNPAFYYFDGNNVIYIGSNGNYNEAKSYKNAYISTDIPLYSSNEHATSVNVLFKDGTSKTIYITVDDSLLIKDIDSSGKAEFISMTYKNDPRYNTPQYPYATRYKAEEFTFKISDIDAWAN